MSQLLLDRIGRCLKLFVSTERSSSHEFVSQFGLDMFVYAKNTQKLSRIPSRQVAPYVTKHTDVRDQSKRPQYSLFLHGLKSVV